MLSSAASFAFGGAPATATNDNNALTEHYQTWAYQAYQKQDLLDNATPIAQGYNSGSHNAFNSSAYGAVYIDPNHSLSITEQLDIGVRTLELDVHWTHQMKDIPHGDALLLCHFGGQRGCSALERYFSDAVAEINDWVRKNPRTVLFMGFEDYWADNEDKMLEALAPLDDLIYKPGTCTDFLEAAKTLTEEDVLKAGKQILLVNGDCATDAWAAAAYRGGWGYTSIAASQADDCLTANASWNGAGVQRIFEQETFFGTTFGNDNGLYSDAQIRKAQKCGVNQVSYDKLVINDPGMKASIWSWAENEPSGGASEDCAFVRSNGHYYDGACSGEGSYYVCKAGPNIWKVTAAYGDWGNGEAACKAEFGSSYSFSMPVNSMQNEHVKNALNGKSHAWVNYTDSANEDLWVTPAHEVDYREGVADLRTLQAGRTYKFYMKAHDSRCELEWEGGDTGAGRRNAKFDCASTGDPMLFEVTEAPSTTDGKPSVVGYINTEAGGYLCGMQWGSIMNSDQEREAWFDCGNRGGLMKMISRSEGSTADVLVRTADGECGLQWSGSADDNNERNAKWDCDEAGDPMMLYGVDTDGVTMQHAIQNTYGCNSGDSRCNKYLEFSDSDAVLGGKVVWQFIPVSGTTDEFYIRSTYGCWSDDQRCYDYLTFGGTDVSIDGSDRVAWKLEPVEGKNDTYYIRSRYNCDSGDSRCDHYLTFSGNDVSIHATDKVEWKLVD